MYKWRWNEDTDLHMDNNLKVPNFEQIIYFPFYLSYTK